MSLKNLSTLLAFLILPLLISSLGSSLSSLTRVYVHSGEFSLSVLAGALVTSTYYTTFLESQTKRVIFIIIFGLLVPLAYIQSANEIYSSGVEQYSELWRPIFAITTLIGLMEILLYIGIFFIFIINTFIKFIGTLTSKKRKRKQWKNYDPSWLVKVSQPYKDEYPWLPAALEACTHVYSNDPAYIYFVESKDANQPGAAWQFQESIILEDTPEGEIILDIIKPNRVGSIEFYDKLD